MTSIPTSYTMNTRDVLFPLLFVLGLAIYGCGEEVEPQEQRVSADDCRDSLDGTVGSGEYCNLFLVSVDCAPESENRRLDVYDDFRGSGGQLVKSVPIKKGHTGIAVSLLHRPEHYEVVLMDDTTELSSMFAPTSPFDLLWDSLTCAP